MRENRPYGSEGGASQTNGTSLPLSYFSTTELFILGATIPKRWRLNAM